MIVQLPGYQILEILHEGVKSIIYRGKREIDDTKVVIKTLKAEYPTLEDITRIRHEYKIIRNLKIEGIANPIELLHHRHGVAIVWEYFDGSSLKEFLTARKKIEVDEFLKIGIQLSSLLGKLHENQIVHKDIKPQNILIDPKTLQVRIIDFSISSRLIRETQTFSSPNGMEGTLAYMSPEQTGRMNRSVDYRTDFYSLGVTFYEMLCGELPFTSTDILELVHNHIAKQPKLPHRLNPTIPQAVSDVVMKLLAKTAEDRYQSALGILADLEICLQQLESCGKIDNFIPGQRDKCGQFLIPQKLYGRETEVRKLLDAFERISKGATEMMLVSGYSGIGKTSVVYEVHKPIVGARGYFISGKFDQFKRNIPYASLIQAFQSLIQQLLTENSENIDRWKAELLEALGQNGQLIIDVIPEVEQIIGKQPAIPALKPTESQNRFNRIFKQFIHVFTKPEHPLVVFLDDLQWADSATLKLLDLLMSDPDSQHLLIVGAYRDNEVDPTHPTIQTIEKIQQTGAVVNHIVLQSLESDRVRELIADTLESGWEMQLSGISHKTVELAQLLFNKTGGNPFFLSQLLQSLYKEKLFIFNYRTGQWEWDIKEIQVVGITDYNVVELIARNIQQLPPQTQQVLKLAACIGNLFNLEAIAIVSEQSVSDTAADLWDALQAGLILPLSNTYKIPLVGEWDVAYGVSEGNDSLYSIPSASISYKFLHDRVQQAAYSLISDSQKKETHLKIGQLLLQHTRPEQIADNIFDIVNQLNIGVEFITDRDRRVQLAGLNLIAGKKAKAATAYQAAVKYLNMGLELLEKSSWEHQYNLTLELFVETVEAEYLTTNFDRAKQLSDLVLHQAKTLLDKVNVYETKIQFYIAQNQMREAILTALEALKLLGVSLPQNPNKLNIILELLRTKMTLGTKKIQDLADLPVMSDPYKIAALRILITLIVPAFLTAPNLFPLVTFKMVELSVRYGNSTWGAYGYALYGWLLCGALGDIESGYQFGQLARNLVEQFDAKEIKSKVINVFNAFIRHWKDPLKETIEPFDEALQSGLETGDIEYVGYSAINSCYYIFFLGEHLETVFAHQEKHIRLMEKLKQEYVMHSVSIVSQLALNLMGRSPDRCRLVGEVFNEDEMLPIFKQANILPSLFATYLSKALLFYLFKDYQKSVENARLAEQYSAGVAGFLTLSEHNFYYSLALLAQYPKIVSASDRKKLLKQVNINQKILKRWATHAPENYQHKYDLVAAEKARFLRRDMQALALYDRAIQGAKQQGYIQEVALANELIAEFYFSRDRENQARFYLTESYYNYIRWGATAKVRDLESKYPHILSKNSANNAMVTSLENSIHLTRTTSSTTGSISAVLDLAAVMKASQAISSEIVLDRLLENLMHVFIENAGAQKGFLILSKTGKLVLAAEGGLERDSGVVLPSIPIETSLDLPLSIVNYVTRTQEGVILNDATVEERFTRDPYILKSQPKAILALPLIHKTKFIGILYLENDLCGGAFTQERLEVLKLLCSQVSISLENAELYQALKTYSAQLEDKNAALRESEKREREKALQLENALNNLKQTQAKLVHTEKISSLGQLVAGVAHEVNNPVGFIAGNLTLASGYAEDLIDLVNLYQNYCANPPANIQEKIEEIDLEYLIEDFPQMISSMKIGTDRIRDIMQSLRNFSRVDTHKPKPADIHACIDSTLMILQHRLKAKAEKRAIRVIKEYGDLPRVICYAGQLNQVFMNLIANAIDALDDARITSEKEIRISTSLRSHNCDSGSFVEIRIKDNGPGMTEEIRQQLFDPFFTTKPEGKGTGLGLSISYQIVVEKHGGSLQCISAPGEGAEFAIAIPLGQ